MKREAKIAEAIPLLQRRRFGPVEFLALVVLFFMMLVTWNRSEKTFGFDFYQFWVTGQEMGKPGAQIYSDTWRQEAGERYWQKAHQLGERPVFMVASDRRRVLQTYSTPVLYSFFGLIGTQNYAHSFHFYQFVHVFAGIAALILLGRMLNFSFAAIVLSIAVLFGWAEAYLSEIYCSNVNQVELLSIAILLWFELRPASTKRDLLCGAWLACIVLFKPNTMAVAGLLGLMWLVDRQFARLIRHGIAFVVTAILLVVITSIHCGSFRCWIEWLGAVGEFSKLEVHDENYSLTAITLLHLGKGPAMAVEWVAPLVTVVAVALSRKRRDPLRLILVVALGCAMSLLASPICWMHYHILAIPLLLIAIRPRDIDEDHGWWLTRNLVAGLSLLMLCTSFLVTDWIWLSDPESRGERLAGSATALFVLNLLELLRRGRPRVANAPAPEL
jgi:hypothetical protein